MHSMNYRNPVTAGYLSAISGPSRKAYTLDYEGPTMFACLNQYHLMMETVLVLNFTPRATV